MLLPPLLKGNQELQRRGRKHREQIRWKTARQAGGNSVFDFGQPVRFNSFKYHFKDGKFLMSCLVLDY
ncbi:hypothetical protein V6N13_125879 [Hibiscus sabdariffa]